jgi:hypothetical protein
MVREVIQLPLRFENSAQRWGATVARTIESIVPWPLLIDWGFSATNQRIPKFVLCVIFYDWHLMVCLGIEFLELELNSNSIYKFWGKKLCLGVEFWNWKILFFNGNKWLEVWKVVYNDWYCEKLCEIIIYYILIV